MVKGHRTSSSSDSDDVLLLLEIEIPDLDVGISEIQGNVQNHA